MFTKCIAKFVSILCYNYYQRNWGEHSRISQPGFSKMGFFAQGSLTSGLGQGIRHRENGEGL